jgi:hypothetical protein
MTGDVSGPGMLAAVPACAVEVSDEVYPGVSARYREVLAD